MVIIDLLPFFERHIILTFIIIIVVEDSYIIREGIAQPVAQPENGSSLVTGVTVCRKEVLEQNPEAAELFVKEHGESAEWVNANVTDAAELVAAAGIIEKAPIAAKAIPYCSIVCIDGEDMKTRLSGYLEALYEMEPSAVGGQMPDDGFYYLHE